MGKLLRLVRIAAVAMRFRLDLVVVDLRRGRTHDARRDPRGIRVRRTLETLGPIFVKFGQILSARPDLVPRDITEELSALLDHVPPFSGAQARAIVEQALGMAVEEAFEAFDETPLASASIAQVHEARLAGGVPVVVKVVRPGLAKVIRRDVGLLRLLAGLVERVRPRGALAPSGGGRCRVREDPVRRARHAARGGRRLPPCAVSSRAPASSRSRASTGPTRAATCWCSTASTALRWTTSTLCARRTPTSRLLAERGAEIFFTQVFRNNFFHADLHPGNIFVSREAPRYIAVDFGIMGSLSDEDQRYLAENLFAFLSGDYRQVAELHVASGWVPSYVRVEEFESAIRAVCEPIVHRPLKDISFAELLVRLFRTARRFEMEVQPQLVLLQKTLLHIEGLGRKLYPDFDLWATGRPFLEQWMRGPDVGAGAREAGPGSPAALDAHRAGASRAASRLPAAGDGAAVAPGPSSAAAPGRPASFSPSRGAGLVIAGALLLGRPADALGLYPGLATAGLGCAVPARRRRAALTAPHRPAVGGERGVVLDAGPEPAALRGRASGTGAQRGTCPGLCPGPTRDASPSRAGYSCRTT